MIGAPITAAGLWLGFGGLGTLLRQESPPPALKGALARIRTRRAYTMVSVAALWVAFLSLMFLCGPGLIALRAALPW